jgi:hypothetical protein
MYLREFIEYLQTVYKGYSIDYKAIEGEPEIAIELNVPVKGPAQKHLRIFNGITPNIKLTRTPEGILILKAEKQVKKIKIKKPNSTVKRTKNN